MTLLTWMKRANSIKVSHESKTKREKKRKKKKEKASSNLGKERKQLKTQQGLGPKK